MELHRSKTPLSQVLTMSLFCNHMELHRSKTVALNSTAAASFVTIWNYTVLKRGAQSLTSEQVL